MADGGAERLAALTPLRRSGGTLLWAVVGMAAFVAVSSWAADGAAPGSATEKEPRPLSVSADSHSRNNEILDLREQIARAPDDAVLHVRLGYLLLDAGTLAEAKAAFDEALKHNRHSHAAMTGEGILLARAGNLKEAEQVLKTALLRNPNPVRTHYELGRVYEASGDLDKALAEYKEGITKFRQGRK